MNWNKDSLLAKAKLFFEKAFNEDRDKIFFGMYCSMGLEFLERAAISKINPVLLAEPDHNQRNVLYALELEVGENPKSIMSNVVIDLCSKFVPDFEGYKKVAQALANRRNEEVHSGAMAFEEYNSDIWLGGFFRLCVVFGDFLDENLDSLFESDIAKEAKVRISEDSEKIEKSVQDKIAARKKVFKEDYEADVDSMKKRIEENEKAIDIQTHWGFHKVTCPVCQNHALIYGDVSTKEHRDTEDDCIVVRKDITPTRFECKICGLKLNSYIELEKAKLPLHYVRTLRYTPEEFYGVGEGVDEESTPWEEYNNE